MFELSSPQIENTANPVHEPNSILSIVNTSNIVVVVDVRGLYGMGHAPYAVQHLKNI
jgi:hypothetical protein